MLTDTQEEFEFKGSKPHITGSLGKKGPNSAETIASRKSSSKWFFCQTKWEVAPKIKNVSSSWT